MHHWWPPDGAVSRNQLLSFCRQALPAILLSTALLWEYFIHASLNLPWPSLSPVGMASLIKTKNRLQDIMEVCCKDAGTLNDFSQLYKSRVISKAQPILVDPTHPLAVEIELLTSGRRYRMPGCRTNRNQLNNTATINVLNEWPVWFGYMQSVCHLKWLFFYFFKFVY